MDRVARPTEPPSILARARAWADWFGFARLVTSALAVAVVCAGAWWLVRSPPPPTEAALPVATTTVTSMPEEPESSETGDASRTMPSSSATGRSGDGIVVVHVAGAVVRPGVYEIDAGSRVANAIERAGGATSEADPGALNLAAVVPDGARVLVPLVGEELPVDLIVGGLGSPTAPNNGGVVDVNRATAEQLDALPGVGPATSAAIIDERERNGPFSSVADLERVPGIGPSKLAAISDLVTT